MQKLPINAATIHAAVLAAASIAPEHDMHPAAHEALCLTAYAVPVYLQDQDSTGTRYGCEAWEAHEWAHGRAMEETCSEWFHLQQLPPQFLTFQTSERGRHKVRNTRARLEAFAADVKARQAAFGGGIKPTPRGPRAAPSWPSTAVRVVWEYLQDRNYAAALEAAEQKAGAVFYQLGAAPFMLYAPEPVQDLEGFQSARRDDGRWVVFHTASGHALGASQGSRKAAIESARAQAADAGPHKLAAAIAKAATCNQLAARAAWIKARGLEIEEPAEIDAADQLAAVVATAAALAHAAAPAEAPTAVLAMADGADECEGVRDLGHAAGAGGCEGVQDLGAGGRTREGVQDLRAGAPAREGVRDLQDDPAAREQVQDLGQLPAREAAAFLADIPREIAHRAFQGVSWTPEKRGDSYRADYAATMAADYAHFHQQATKGGTVDQLAEEFARYREGYRRRMLAWLATESRCVSSWIAGRSNFPAARMNKRADIAHRRMGELIEFRERARRAIVRKLRPDLRPIMAGDADAADKLAAKIATAERLQECMKQANAAIRKHAKAGPSAQVPALMELGYSEARAALMLKPDFCGRVGFADYELTNNGANIRRMRARLEEIERAHATQASEREGDSGIALQDDPPANRVRLIFPDRPAQDVRDQLKAAGFRWAPSVGAWQAYRNWRALETARRIAGVKADTAAGAGEASAPAPERDQGPAEAQPATSEGVQDLQQAAAGCEGVQDLQEAPARGNQEQAPARVREEAPARDRVQDLSQKAPAVPVKRPARRFVPALGQRVASKAGAWEAWLYRKTDGTPCLVFYEGRAEKPKAHTWFRSDSARLPYLARLAQAADERAGAKAARKASAARPHPLTVGTVLVHSWGYDQTNVDFYEVTAVIGAATVEIRGIKGEKHHTGDMNGRCVPCPGEYIAAARRCRARPDGSVKVSDSGHAYPAEIVGQVQGKPVYRSYTFTEWG